MITLHNISVAFAHQRPLFSNLSCTIPTGSRICLVGQNGIGKSTLIKVIAGLIRPQHGTIVLNDVTATHMSIQQRPSAGCIQTMTVRQNLALASLKGQLPGLQHEATTLAVDTLCDQAHTLGFALEPLLDRTVSHLSGGQQQLICFLMATMHQPAILLLDEPTAALSPSASAQLGQAIKRFAAQHNTTVLCVTHDESLPAHIGADTWELTPHSTINQFA